MMLTAYESQLSSVLLYKRLGETPLECILRYKKVSGENRVMTYAGRLDPLAEGVLLCLIGDECKNKDRYLSLSKKYKFEILVGFSTDTHDLLGIVDECGNPRSDQINSKLLQEFIGKRLQKYPAYSSKTVDGVQLHTLAREDRLADIEIPSREVEIFDLRIIGKRKIDDDELLSNIISKIDLVKGDFRQDIIKNRWDHVLRSNKSTEFEIYELEMSCSSGTYVRALIRDTGDKIGVPMCAFSIIRTGVGEFNITSIKSY